MIFKIANPKTGRVERNIRLLPKQEEFLLSDSRYTLFSGGFGAGKTYGLLLKCLLLLKKYPNNLGLLGRMHYQELRDTVQKEFLQLCPRFWIKKYVRSENKLVLFNGSELLFRHLDKMAETEIRSLNLGFFAIDQAEEVIEPVYLALKGRLRRVNTSQQGFMTCNPAGTWLYREFKQQSKPENKLFETATTENIHLPRPYVQDLLNYPEQWKRQFVYGDWSVAVVGDRNVYALDIIRAQEPNIISSEKAKLFGDVRIYLEPKQDDVFQMGVDCAEGVGGDASCLSVTNTRTGEEAAFWMGQLPPDLLEDKAEGLLNHFNIKTKRPMLVVPEVNGIGISFLNKLKKKYPHIYAREVFLKRVKEKKEILGWKTTVSTKPLLILNHVDLLRNNLVKVHTPEILEQMKTFVYNDEVGKSGMGADPGFHDDAVIAHALASFYTKPQKLLLMGTNKSRIGVEAFNPIAKSFHDEFRWGRREYDWQTDC